VHSCLHVWPSTPFILWNIIFTWQSSNRPPFDLYTAMPQPNPGDYQAEDHKVEPVDSVRLFLLRVLETTHLSRYLNKWRRSVLNHKESLRWNVRMPYFSIELHFRRLIRVLVGKLDIYLVMPTFVRSVFLEFYKVYTGPLMYPFQWVTSLSIIRILMPWSSPFFSFSTKSWISFWIRFLAVFYMTWANNLINYSIVHV
jgi:hypothetical protein